MPTWRGRAAVERMRSTVTAAAVFLAMTTAAAATCLAWRRSGISRRCPEAAHQPFDVPGEIESGAIFQVGADDLDADRQAGLGTAYRHHHRRQIDRARQTGPDHDVHVGL